MIFIDVSFNMHPNASNPSEVIDMHKEGHGYAHALKKYAEPLIIEHINFEGHHHHEGVDYHFFKGHNRFWHRPAKAVSFIEQRQPEMVIVAGLIFPLQVIYLRKILGKQAKILVQHHGEHPFPGVKRAFQKWANSATDGYLFTSYGNAEDWIEQGIISEEKCFEVLEASTYLTRKDQIASRRKLSLPEESDIFLWVGRLDQNKDPLTVLAGFEKYLAINETARLYMIYQETGLLREAKAKIDGSNALSRAVHLIGKVPHAELEVWYSAADYYVSGSHKEGSGYALLEAMACGCIPVVTDIPSFRMITGGKGYLYNRGNSNSLYYTLCSLSAISKVEKSLEVVNYFNSSLSFDTIAQDIMNVYRCLSE